MNVKETTCYTIGGFDYAIIQVFRPGSGDWTPTKTPTYIFNRTTAQQEFPWSFVANETGLWQIKILN